MDPSYTEPLSNHKKKHHIKLTILVSRFLGGREQVGLVTTTNIKTNFVTHAVQKLRQQETEIFCDKKASQSVI